jgi:nitrate reductase gamma subunit
MDYLNNLLFDIYPYVALSIFLLGSLIRYDRDQYTWKADSSQLLRRGQLRLGSNLFHIGIIGLFFGHFAGLLTPKDLYHALGLTTESKQLLAMAAGGVMGSMAMIGVLLLLHRRLTDPRIRKTCTGMDIFILVWIFVTLALGLLTIPVSAGHMDGRVMILLANWAQSIVTFQPGAAEYLATVSWAYKIHLLFGMTLFVLFPFTRLVHVWSGFGSVGYLFRPHQVVRKRR